jgi:Tfp pilus assembly protein PilN
MAERQQINLYQPAADLSRQPFSARAAVLCVSAVLVAVLGIWAYGSWQVSRMQKAVTALEQQQRHQEDTLNAAGAIHAARAKPAQLEAQIRELTAELATRRLALTRLHSGAEGETVGFSARLSGLARRHVEGLWIDHIVLSGSAETMTLEGVALDADMVPRYLRDLAQDPALTGARFDELVIERPVARAAKGEEAAAQVDSRAALPAKGMRFRAESQVTVTRAGAAS